MRVYLQYSRLSAPNINALNNLHMPTEYEIFATLLRVWRGVTFVSEFSHNSVNRNRPTAEFILIVDLNSTSHSTVRPAYALGSA